MTAPARTPNRLLDEKSPYLLQHAKNPVDWYPWGDEAFAKAREENKPVFLSIGYSTCHWCHVMARESFMDSEVAAALNRDYVAVKVDREERPDVDHVYMNVCQMLTGSGGWPLTVIMTPEKKPFFAGTYYPKESRFGLPGVLDILKTIQNAWATDEKALRDQADRVYAALKETGGRKTASDSVRETGNLEIMERAYRHLSESFDEEHGGFGGAPKFPTPHTLLFLLRYWKRTGQRRALEMVEKTLTCANAGGIYDHVGFGFYRYSTDARWLVPHFEKMLYDQAMMIMAYTELWLCTKKNAYKDVVYEIASFLDVEMKSPDAAFWSAIDAESEGEEGRFYVWTPAEVVEALGAKDGQAYCRAFDITVEGNFHGKSIPNLVQSRDRIGATREAFSKNRRKLYFERAKRPRPGVDDKVLTSWNALCIAALAKAGRAFHDPALVETASAALNFIEQKLVRDGTPFARYRDGETAYRGYLDDHAFLIWAYIEMREATQDPRYLRAAAALARRMIASFWDPEGRGFFVTGQDSEELIVRPKETWDGAIPSGNSVAVMDLLRLYHLLDEEEFRDTALAALDGLWPAMQREPTGLLHLVSAAMYQEGGALDVLAVGPKDDSELQAMLSYIGDVYLPDSHVMFAEDRPDMRDVAPPSDGDAVLVMCRGRTCSAPLRSVNELQRALLTAPAPALRL